MKPFLVAMAIVVCCCFNAAAQTVKIELYSDVNRASCEFSDQSAGLHTVYVFATGNTSISGLRFTAPKPDCWVGATWIADIVTQPGGSLGNSQTDWNVSYGVCMPLPALAAQINYFATGGSLPCCPIVAKDPGTITDDVGNIIHRFNWYGCGFSEHPLQAGQKIMINPDNSCRCQNPLATENSTWGRIKSLYR